MPKSIPYLIIFALLVLIFYFGCRPTPPRYIIPDLTQQALKAVEKRVNTKLAEVEYLKSLEPVKDSVRVVWRTRWREAKQNPERLPCDSAFNKLAQVGDSTQSADSAYIHHQRIVIANQDTVITDLQRIIGLKDTLLMASRDSTKNALQEVRRQKWIKRGIIAIWIVRESAGLYSDTQQ